MASQSLAAPRAPTRPPARVSVADALELVRKIPMPRQLPETYKGERLRCLSFSSISRFEACMDDWRRHYLLGERMPPSGSMFLGNRLDETESAYFRALLEGGGPLNLGQLHECFEEAWRRSLREELEKSGSVRWEYGTTQRTALDVGFKSLEVFLGELVPQLGRPLRVQDEFEFEISPDVEWTVKGSIDLDNAREVKLYVDKDGRDLAVQNPTEDEPTVSVPWSKAPKDLRPALKKRDPDDSDRQAAAYQKPVEVPASRLASDIIDVEVAGVSDYKAKGGRAIYQNDADGDTQATLCLAHRALVRGEPAFDFAFAQLLTSHQGKRAKITKKFTYTRRSLEDLQKVFVRIAQVASTIHALNEVLGPEQPWGFAPEGSWKCRANRARTAGLFCAHWATCPMGAGIGVVGRR